MILHLFYANGKAHHRSARRPKIVDPKVKTDLTHSQIDRRINN